MTKAKAVEPIESTPDPIPGGEGIQSTSVEETKPAPALEDMTLPEISQAMSSIIQEYGGIVSSIPINHRYWDLRKELHKHTMVK